MQYNRYAISSKNRSISYTSNGYMCGRYKKNVGLGYTPTFFINTGVLKTHRKICKKKMGVNCEKSAFWEIFVRKIGVFWYFYMSKMGKNRRVQIQNLWYSTHL